MNRDELIKKIHTREVESFTSYDYKDFNAYVSNLLEDFLHKCSDEELKEMEDKE